MWHRFRCSSVAVTPDLRSRPPIVVVSPSRRLFRNEEEKSRKPQDLPLRLQLRRIYTISLPMKTRKIEKLRQKNRRHLKKINDDRDFSHQWTSTLNQSFNQSSNQSINQSILSDAMTIGISPIKRLTTPPLIVEAT